ncbi:MAG: Ca2+-binding RTX toxin-like protein, partial [Planctomycetaceae bacterium]
PWLKDFCAKLNRPSHSHSRRPHRPCHTGSRNSNGAVEQSLEILEDRTLLAASVLFGSGELQILTDANETVLIREDPVTPGRVDVQIGTSTSAATTAPSLPNVAVTDVRSIVLITGSGNNTIDLSGVLASAFTGLTSINVQGGNGDDIIIGSADLAVFADGQDGNDSITGGSADDTLVGGDGADTIAGLAGNDSIDAGDGDDVVTGDDGDDTILADDGNDTVSGNLGNDNILGGDGEDSLSGNEGLDTLNGNSGADTISGDDGVDFILGGGGDDLITGGLEGDTIIGNAGSDTLSGDDGADFVHGGSGNDSLFGNEGDDTLNGMGGEDTLDGGGGNDTILGGDGDDVALGDGPDVNIVTFGNDVIRGQGGNDTLRGTLGADTIEGGDGDDEIQSELAVNLPPPIPPAPVAPPLPPTPPFVSQFDPAVGTGGTTDLGALATLSTGAGDRSLQVTVNAAGQPTISLYDPVGAIGPTDPSFLFTGDITANFTGVAVDGGAVALLDAGGATLMGSTTDATSIFSQSNLDFALLQQVEPLTDSAATTIGALLTQSYSVTNPGTSTVTLEFLRGTHYHSSDFGFNGVTSAGGRFFDASGVEILVQSNMLGNIDTIGTITGITGISGDPVPVSRFGVNQRPNDVTAVPGRLDDMVVDDNDGDGFDDVGVTDTGLSLRSVFTIPAGGTVQFTQHLFFADAAPSALAGVANMPPVATADAVSVFATPVTFIPVTNDLDSDGVLDFASIQIETQPLNGTAVSLGDGRITYTSNPGFSGVDTFTYSIADDGGARSAPATVSITVIEAADTIGDSLDGGLGNDTIIGGAGDDFINGRSGGDSLSGAQGNDTILAGAGDDTLSGGAGNDTLDGQSGNDVVNGDEGEDVIVFGGTGDGLDIVDGGSGSDTVRVSGTANDDTFRVSQDALGLLTVSQATSMITIDPSSVQTVIVNGLAGDDFIGIDSIPRVGRIVLIVNGGFGDDILDAGWVDSGSVILELNGEGGDDTLAGGKQNDRLNGGIGNDSLFGGDGDDTLSGGDGQDIISGGWGQDIILGDAGNDTLSGDNGNDVIDGGLDNDVASGGNGDDTIRGNFGNDALNGNAGNDSILGLSGKDTIVGGSGNDTLDGGREDDRIGGQSGNDLIRGDHGDDFINGGTGNDEIVGEDGDDTIMGGDGADGISGGDGDDFIEGQGMNDTITGGDGNDTLRGGGGDDTILGEQGDDVINGNSGTDTAAVGEGADPATTDVEVIDENFVLDSEMMMNLDGV